MSYESSNVLQATYWTEIGGPHWVRQQPMFDHMLAPFGDEALRALAVQPGETVLDVGCGTGTTSLALCAAVGPHGQVFGCDISATMVDAARLRGASHDCLSFIVADAQTDRLVPEDRLADAVYSRFGVMFFADPQAALANIASNVHDGGRLAFVCWRHEEFNEWIALPARIMSSFTPEPVKSPPDAPGPFAFGDPDRVRSVLSGGGWSDIRIEPFTALTTMGGGLGIDTALEQSMATRAGQLLRSQVDDATFAEATAAVRNALADHVVDEAVVFPGNAWIVTARRP